MDTSRRNYRTNKYYEFGQFCCLEGQARQNIILFNEYLVKNDKLYRQIYNEINVWVVPQNVRMQICRLYHNDAGHLSVEKTLDRIKQNYWFAGMCHFIIKYVSACLNCAYYKHNAEKRQCKLNSIDNVPVSFHKI